MITASIRFLALAAGPLLAAPVFVAAQDGGAAGWLPWLGCWEAEGAPADAAGAPVVCIEPGASGAATFITIRDGAVVSRHTLAADGERHALESGGCAGWESASWAEDRRRLFMRSELSCEGARRVSSGILAFLPDGTWLDARGIEVGETVVSTVRYRPASHAAERIAGITEKARAKSLAVGTARKVAGATLSVADVTEASRSVPGPVVQALLAERGTGFALDAETLLALAEAGVPGETTDLMVALSYPDVFEVERGSIAFAERPGTSRGDGWNDPFVDPWNDPWRNPHRGRWGRGGWDRYGACGVYGCNGNGYYGNGYYGGGYYGGPVVVVRRRDPDAGGVAVKGKGYTRRGTQAGAPSQSGSSAGRATVTRDKASSAPRSGTSGGSSEPKTERRAKRRGGS